MNEPMDVTIAKIQAATQLTTARSSTSALAREAFSGFYRAVSEAVRDGDDPPPVC